MGQNPETKKNRQVTPTRKKIHLSPGLEGESLTPNGNTMKNGVVWRRNRGLRKKER